MRTGNAYLDCRERREAQDLWWSKLTDSGYFAMLPEEMVAVEAALGRTVAHSIYARQSSPHYNSAAMDGIAINAADTYGAQETEPKRMSLLAADTPFTSGNCYLVDTGDPLPHGTNAVIMIEDVHWAEGQAEIIAAAVPWQHVRIIGEDIVANEMIMPEHQIVTPVDIAALLAAGVEVVSVLRRPLVAVIPTGDELVDSAADLAPGKILDVNSRMLAASVREWGGEPLRRGIVPDDRAALKCALQSCFENCDMVIVNAGTSAGTEDFTAAVVAELGELLVHGIAIKPGKPVMLAICEGKPVVGLPGYPVSALLTAEMFVRDILLARQRLPRLESPRVQAFLARQVASQLGVEEYVRVSLGEVQGRTVAVPLGRGAGMITSLTKAQGIVRIDAASSGLSAGARTDVTLLRKTTPKDSLLAIGSHDLALELLGVFLRHRCSTTNLCCANVGSMGGIMAIRANEAHIAGIHLLDPVTGRYNIAYAEKYLGTEYFLVHFAQREQGIMVAPGNPKNVTGLQDLGRPGIKFVNRQRGSGTRMLLDYELKRQGMDAAVIDGYEKEVGTHMAVAASVASGTVDAGMGVRAAAQALGLDFIPVAQEQYDLLLNFPPTDERRRYILEILQASAFRQAVEALGGYDLREAGKILVAGAAINRGQEGEGSA